MRRWDLFAICKLCKVHLVSLDFVTGKTFAWEELMRQKAKSPLTQGAVLTPKSRVRHGKGVFINWLVHRVIQISDFRGPNFRRTSSDFRHSLMVHSQASKVRHLSVRISTKHLNKRLITPCFPSQTQCLKITQNVTFQFCHFPPIFDLLKLTSLVTLFDLKLSRVIHPNFFDNFSREIKVVNS